MCRVLGYLGPPRSLRELLVEPPHSLEVQSYAPREMEEALLNADGFGVAWYAPGHPEPARYRTILPMWADENVRAMSGPIESGCVVAAVRSATPGIGHGMANTQPFSEGPLSYVHNGFLKGFREGPMRAIRRTLGDAAYGAIRGTSDSEHLFALFLDAYAEQPDLSGALRESIARVERLRDGRCTLLGIVASDGRSLVAVRQAFDGRAPTLYRRDEAGATFIASEPTTAEGRWEPLPEGEVVLVSREGS
jgi:ergothioneine biosynthesis protein EgtC